MAIDWEASKEAWIGQVQSTLIPQLRADQRLVGSDVLKQRFALSIRQWRRDGAFRPVINDGNELCAAVALLAKIDDSDRLIYERRLRNTPKSIDFCIEKSDGAINWFDMKTVAPGWQDDEAGWARLSQIAANFPSNAALIVNRDFAGAALGGQLIKTRWSFVQRTSELESKVALLADEEQGPVRLLLCSEGAWHEDDLEDFADFYHSGNFREDDWARNAISRYMEEREIVFNHSIAGFCYLKRGHEDIEASRFVIDVRGPTF